MSSFDLTKLLIGAVIVALIAIAIALWLAFT